MLQQLLAGLPSGSPIRFSEHLEVTGQPCWDIRAGSDLKGSFPNGWTCHIDPAAATIGSTRHKSHSKTNLVHTMNFALNYKC